jgi:hypothetical protein
MTLITDDPMAAAILTAMADGGVGHFAGAPGPLDVLPVADGTGLPWDVPVDDAVAAIAEARATCGDTFVVHSGGNDYLFTFSPTGVESFYALPEEVASKGVADYLMLRRKLPDELLGPGRDPCFSRPEGTSRCCAARSPARSW